MRSSILTDAFFNSLESSAREVEVAEMLPPACYVDRDFWEFEKEAVFSHEWLCVGREAWAKNPGDYFTSAHMGEPIVVVRNRDGVLKAMSTVCQHRAMLVVEGRGNAKAFLCPYHHWSYSLDGNLIGAPAMDKTCNFDPTKVRLAEFKLEVWLGFVFINFDLNAPPLAPRLSALTKALEHYDIANCDEPSHGDTWTKCPWNWKVHLENSNDGYHANRLHKGPVHDLCPSSMASFPELPADTAGYFRYNGTVDIDVGFNPTRKAILPLFPRLTAEDRRRFIFANIPPSFQMFARPDWATFTIFHAEGPEEMSFERSWMVAPGVSKEPLFQERLNIYFATSATIGAQDRHVDALVQVGLRSKFANRGRYSWQERAQQDLNNWLVPRYRSTWEKIRNSKQAH
jgi:phenylpropionate dioxygenase-like ring-hydroxylating dioxygenase large terminal subunit